MRTSNYKLYTLKENPVKARLVSHKFMIKSGMIRQSSSGFYSWLPLGFKILKKLEKFICKVMENVGFAELSLPIIQPTELWEMSGRLNLYGHEIIRFKDRSSNSFLLSPTNEEFITNLIINEITSKRDFPINLYQIQTKFRDEIRPSFGVMRSKEFIMKDAYSFHLNNKSLQHTYEVMHNTYCDIFNQLNLKFHVKQVDCGLMGGKISHEFRIFFNEPLYDKERFFHKFDKNISNTKLKPLIQVSAKNIKKLPSILKVFKRKFAKIILVKTHNSITYPYVALMIRSNYFLDKVKAEMLPQVLSPLQIIKDKKISYLNNIHPSFLGPINLPFPLIVDRQVILMKNLIVGANLNGKYLINFNWKRDMQIPQIADLCKSHYSNLYQKEKNRKLYKHELEIGHIFQIGTKYSSLMKNRISNLFGNKNVFMGCYGIGLTRLLAAIIEKNYVNNVIVWPDVIVPFAVVVIPIFGKDVDLVKKVSDKIYLKLKKYNIDVLLDDRKVRSGVMFNDMDLIGIPHQLLISCNLLKENKIEYKNLVSQERYKIPLKELMDFLLKRLVF